MQHLNSKYLSLDAAFLIEKIVLLFYKIRKIDRFIENQK